MHEAPGNENKFMKNQERESRQTFCTSFITQKISQKRRTTSKNFKKLKNSSGKKIKQKAPSYKKQAVINPYGTELREEQKSILNLGLK